MAAIAEELARSRSGTTGQNPSFEFKYWVHNADSEGDARQAVGNASLPTYNPFLAPGVYYPRTDIELDPRGQSPDGKFLFEATVYYGGAAKPATTPDPPVQESEYFFDTGGGSKHVILGIKKIASETPGRILNPLSTNGLIGVSENSVEGVDIVVSDFNFSETHYILDADMTQAYADTVAALTGHVNSLPFKNYAAGEVLFIGATGAKRRTGNDWELNYRFSVRKNEPAPYTLPSGSIWGDIVFDDGKKGWHYLWLRHKLIWETTPTRRSVNRRITDAYIDQVYPESDLNALGI